MEDVLDKLKVRRRLLHHDGTGGVVVGPERNGSGFWRNDDVILVCIDVKSKEECWPWIGKRYPSGYGRLSVGKHIRLGAHRAIFALLFGSVPNDLVVRHDCDNPPCVNPFHLLPGTNADNVDDMMVRGRKRPAIGERTSAAKLTRAQIPEIRSLHAAGLSQREIAKRFSVSDTSIYQVVHRICWRHVP